MIINNMPGGASLGNTTATANTIFNGYTAYDGDGNLITGNALSTPSSVGETVILSGYSAYASDGTYIQGNMPNRSWTNTQVPMGSTITLPYGYYYESTVTATGGSSQSQAFTYTTDMYNQTFTINVGVFPKVLVEIPMFDMYCRFTTSVGASGGANFAFFNTLQVLNCKLYAGQNKVYQFTKTSGANYTVVISITYHLDGTLTIYFYPIQASYGVLSVYQNSPFTVQWMPLSDEEPRFWEGAVTVVDAGSSAGIRYRYSFDCGFTPSGFVIFPKFPIKTGGTGTADVYSQGANSIRANVCYYTNGVFYSNDAGMNSNAFSYWTDLVNSAVKVELNSNGATWYSMRSPITSGQSYNWYGAVAWE